jgi:hypothetical protein
LGIAGIIGRKTSSGFWLIINVHHVVFKRLSSLPPRFYFIFMPTVPSTHRGRTIIIIHPGCIISAGWILESVSSLLIPAILHFKLRRILLEG